MAPLAALTFERDWPWRDADLLGWPGLLLVAALLVLLTIWTYAGQAGIGWRRLLTVLALRLAALAVVALLVLRPTFASEERSSTPGKLIILLDSSLSMKFQDSPNSSTRWDFIRKILDAPEVKTALQRLQTDKQTDVIFYQAAEDARTFDSTSDADGKRTDIGKWLNTLWTRHRNDRNLRGLLIFSDGADNGTSHPVFDEAAKWRNLPCQIFTFGAGSEATKTGQRDLAVVDVTTEKEIVFVKNSVPIKAVIDAPNLEGQTVTLRLFVDGNQVSVKENLQLPNSRGNVVDAGVFTPDKVGEVKITVKVDVVPGEFTPLNNEMSTYINVRKEGISILWVDRPLRWEATWILRALSINPRFSITYDERPRDQPLTAEQAKFFTTSDKAFDVVVIGDVTANRFSGGDSAFLDRVANHVATKRTGLLMLGGYSTFGNSDWDSTGKAIASLLPVELTEKGQIDMEVRALPVDPNHRLLRLDTPVKKDLWLDVFFPLKGQTKLGTAKADSVPLLRTEAGPLLVVTRDEGPRVAAFGGDTTFTQWYDNDDAVRAYERFWTQLITWLARQDDSAGQVWVKLDKRRIAVGANQKLGFSVGADGKDGQPIRNARFEVKVHGPAGEVYDVATALKLAEERGEFRQADSLGEYKVEVTATAPGPKGERIPLGSASARFIGFTEDVENQQPAANHQELFKLASAGGGSFRIAGKDELLQCLAELGARGAASSWVKRDVWPNWKVTPASNEWSDQLAALTQSMGLVCLGLFLVCIATEWFLRRLWGLV